MEDAFKKFLYAGVDLAAEVSTKFEEGVKDLIEPPQWWGRLDSHRFVF